MKEEPDSLSVPYNFARCFNAQCPQAPKCLRHIATQLDTGDFQGEQLPERAPGAKVRRQDYR